jgi:hypothetical protein
VIEPPFRTPELRPEIVFVFDLMQQLVDGRLRIPQFQRPFVWRPHQMIDLLDSISKQYPIGSLLAWETDEDIVSLETVGPIHFSAKPGVPAAYLLDGHQRLSTLAGALVGEDNRSQDISDEDALLWSIYFNAKDRTFEHVASKTPPEPYYFPMSRLLDTFEFLQESQRVINDDPVNGRLYVERIQEVARSFQNYKIPVMQIKQTGLNEAVEIFARLNSRGQSMTADQMVSALLYRGDEPKSFNLAKAIDDSIGLLRLEGFGDIDRTLILRSLLAAIGEDIYRTDWTRLARSRRENLLDKLKDAIPRVNKSLEATVMFFRDHLGVTTARLLPYGMQMTVVSSFFYAQPDPSPQQLALLRRWFWVTSFATWFGGANPSRVNALVRDVMDRVAKERENPAFRSIDLSTPAVPVPRSFDMRSARTRVLLLVLFNLQPRDRHGNVIERVDDLVRIYGPDALGYVASSVDDRELARSPGNRILRERPDERGQARNWLLAVPESMREVVWKSHAIPLDAGDELYAADGSGFVQARLMKLTELEHQFMAARQVTPPLTDTPAPATADSEVFAGDDD